MAGEFVDLWTLAEAAKDPYRWRPFLSLVWENTSGYLLCACAVSLLALVLSWVYLVRAEPPTVPDRGPRTRDRGKARARAKPREEGEDQAEPCPVVSDDLDPPPAAPPSAGLPPPPPSPPPSPSRTASSGHPTTSGQPGTAGDPGAGGKPAGGKPRDAGESRAGAEQGEDALPDLVEMAHHLPGRVKRAELRSIRQRLQGDMTEEQRQRERQVEMDQMAAIMELMQKNSDKFGQPSLDDMQSQLKLYM